jgi:aminoglycoside 6'-N-acetyltransferase I
VKDEVEIRAAGLHDAHAWAAMRAALWPEADSSELIAEVNRHFSGGQRAAEAVFVAVAGNAPAGFIELSLRSVAEGCTSSPIPYVEAWYVQPAFQRRGIGRLLVEEAERWARGLGYSEIASDSVITNDDGAAAHRRLGFIEVERAIHFHKRLDEEII